MKFLAMIAAMFAASGPAVAMPAPAVGWTPRPTNMVRTRIKGKPGRAGDKLARMAAEGRLGVGCPR